MIKGSLVGLLGCNGFVGKNLSEIFEKKKINFLGINRNNHKEYLQTKFDFLINAACLKTFLGKK